MLQALLRIQVYFVYYYVAGRLDLFDDGIEKVEPIFKAQSVYKADIAFKLVKSLGLPGPDCV